MVRPPLGAVVRGAGAGAVGTLAMDLPLVNNVVHWKFNVRVIRR